MLLNLLNEWKSDHAKETAVQNKKKRLGKSKSRKEGIDEELLTTN